MSDGNAKVDMMVSPVRMKSAPMEDNWVPIKLVKLFAPLQVKLPPMVSIPEISMAPAAVEAISKDPLRLVHEDASAVASA